MSATDTGLCSPSANSNVGWDSPWDAYSSNDWRARADRTQDVVQYYNFNLTAIPSGATIDGIEVRVEGYQDGGTTPRQAEISLSWDNGVSYTTGDGTGMKTTNMPGPNPWDEAVRTFGGSGDTWGRTWSSGDFVNANFRVKLDAILASSFHYLYVDHVQVGVYYRDGTTTAVASSFNPSAYGESVTFTATVTRTSGTSTPTGTVEFWDGATLLGTDTLSTVSDGVAEAALATSSLGAGSHSITAVYGGDSNFGGSSGNLGGGQTVNQRPITVTADAKSKVYGESDPALTYQITSGSLVFGDTFSGALSRVAGENVGSYAIQQGTLTLSSNYNLTYADANLSITARPITVTADAQSKVYGNSDPALTCQITSGSLAFSDTFTGALSRESGEDVGSYAIQQGTLALSSNYNLTYTGANLSITAKSLTITANDRSKVHGDTVTFAGTEFVAIGLVNADAVASVTLTSAGADAAGAAGIYDIVPSEAVGTGLSNYDIAYVNGTLTVNPRTLTITAADRSKTYGDTVTFAGTEFTADGLVNSDTVTGVTLTSPGADATAASGIYDIAPSAATGTGMGNYSITYVDGTFTVKKAITIWNVTSSPTRSSRGNTVTFTATVNDPGATGTVTFKDGGIVLGSGTLSNGEATCTTSTLSKGSHYITIVYDGDANFTEGSSLAHLHGVKTPAGFPWWIIVVIVAAAATGGLFFWLFLRRRRQEGQPAYS